MRRHLLRAVCVAVLASACDKPQEPAAKAPAASAKEPASIAATPKESASAAPSAGSEIALVPKVSFGPIKLGATKAEIEALGVLKVHPQYSGMTIPWTVYYDEAGKAKRIQLSFQYAPGDVRVGALLIPRTSTYAGVKTLLGDCKDEPPAKGGTTSKCRDGAVNVSFGSGSPTEVWLEAALP